MAAKGAEQSSGIPTLPWKKRGEFPGMDGAPGAGQKPKPVIPMDEPKDTELVMGSRMGSRVPVIIFAEEKILFPPIFPGRRMEVVAELVGQWRLQEGGVG